MTKALLHGFVVGTSVGILAGYLGNANYGALIGTVLFLGYAVSSLLLQWRKRTS